MRCYDIYDGSIAKESKASLSVTTRRGKPMSIDQSTPIAVDTPFLEGIPPTSWMSYVLRGMPLIDAAGRTIPKSVHATPAVETKVVSFDIGNDAAKVGVLDSSSRFQCVRIPTTYCPAKPIRHGDGVTEWRLCGDESSESF